MTRSGEFRKVRPAERRTRQSMIGQAVQAVKAQQVADSSLLERIADRIAGWAASTWFLAVHVVWFGGWVAWNTGLIGLRPFDPFPFGLLTMVVSLEAIFLSIFILLSQARESEIAELREETTLAVQLRTEAEVTKTLQLVAGLYRRFGHPLGEDEELREMLRPLDAKRIEAELLQQLKRARKSPRSALRAVQDAEEPASPAAAPEA